jgi:2-polyprenyl-3-methyl-5-hydroxy-6-metoxy-1,4-benzoquinol methylase
MDGDGATLDPAPGSPAGALSARVRRSAAATFDLMSIWLGERLSLYRGLADGPATPSELAGRAGANARMVREWLEHQAVTGLLEVEDVGVTPDERRYRLPEGGVEALTDRDSVAFAVPTAAEVLHAVGFLLGLETALRSGGGLVDTYGWREGRPDGNRARYLHQLTQEWLPAAPEVHERLLADPPARVADLGVGSGWSSIAMALAYPRIHVDGFDLDEVAIGFASRHAAEAGVGDRVVFLARDASDHEFAGRYDLVTVFEALHDLARPVEALSAVRGLLADGGSVVVADERVPEAFAAPGSDFDRYIYGWSVMSCLPASMTDPSSVATGAVMRPDTLRRYAEEAGFGRVEILPIDHFEWRFYRLIP